MRKVVATALFVIFVEFVIAPIGGRVFDYFFPETLSVDGLLPDIPYYHWGYASVLAAGVLLGIAVTRRPDKWSAEACKAIRERQRTGLVPITLIRPPHRYRVTIGGVTKDIPLEVGDVAEFEPALSSRIVENGDADYRWFWDRILHRRYRWRYRGRDDIRIYLNGSPAKPFVAMADVPPAYTASHSNSPIAREFKAKGLYVGQMNVAVGHLKNEGWLEITARCFNATGHAIFLHRCRGVVSLRESIKGAGTKLGPLPPLALVDDRTKSTEIQDSEEFLVVLEQRVPKDIAAKILSVTDENHMHLRFTELDVLVCSHTDGKSTARLPFWDAVSLSRRDSIQSGRVFEMHIEPITLRVGASLDSPKDEPRETPRALAQALDDLLKEGTRERNRLIPALADFDYAAERQRLVDWSHRVVARLRSEFVRVGECSRFETLGEYQPELMSTQIIHPEQAQIQTMWTEKLKRLRPIIDRID